VPDVGAQLTNFPCTFSTKHISSEVFEHSFLVMSATRLLLVIVAILGAV
jgi:hypothetical protein